LISYESNSLQISCPSDCSNNGKCILNGTNAGNCTCNPGYIKDDCSYKQKSKRTAFLFYLFLGEFGAGNFYLGYVITGTFELFFTLLICIIPCLPLYCLCCIEEEGFQLVYTLVVLSIACIFIGIWIWWLVEWILLIADQIPEANGQPLYNDM